MVLDVAGSNPASRPVKSLIESTGCYSKPVDEACTGWAAWDSLFYASGVIRNGCLRQSTFPAHGQRAGLAWRLRSLLRRSRHRTSIRGYPGTPLRTHHGHAELEDRGLRQRDLTPVFGSSSFAGDVMNGEREISKEARAASDDILFPSCEPVHLIGRHVANRRVSTITRRVVKR